MTKTQFLLMKLAEECAEVAQRAIKQIQFGQYEAQAGQDKNNMTRLRDELLDLYAMQTLLVMDSQLERITAVDILQATMKKKDKLQKYLDLSHGLGELPEIKL